MPHHSQNKVVRFVGEKRFRGSAGTYKKNLQMEEPFPIERKTFSQFRACKPIDLFQKILIPSVFSLNCFLSVS
jgi:hypothetical protein